MGRALLALAALCAAGCGTTPEVVEAGGRGLVDADATPPDGVRVWSQPALGVGDRFAYRRGGLVDVVFKVVEAGEAGYVFEEESTGLRNLFTKELWVQGQQMPGNEAMDRRIEPFDAQLTWPLWVGKRWVSHFVRAGGAAGDMPVIARYECDAVETLSTPAGELECVRIWRRSMPAVEEKYFERNDLLWYAPAVGFFARKLEDGLLTELQAFSRAPVLGGG
jgi:hypothetical protein